MIVEFASGRTERQYQIGIVNRNEQFQPVDWADAPSTAVLVEVVGCARSRAEAESWVFGFNSAALALPGGRWAILLAGDELFLPGDHCARRLVVFRRQVRPRPAAS